MTYPAKLIAGFSAGNITGLVGEKKAALIETLSLSMLVQEPVSVFVFCFSVAFEATGVPHCVSIRFSLTIRCHISTSAYQESLFPLTKQSRASRK